MPVVEAMEARLPVVAVDRGALPEVVGDAGVLLTARDPYDLAEAIGSLLRDSQRREVLAAAAPRRLAELDLPTAADRFAGLLCTFLDGQGGKR